MGDYLSEMRQLTIDNFQSSMRAIRLLMGYSVNELADYIGVTRQTINNLETGKSKMSVVQFLALASVVDNYTQTSGELYQAIESVLDGNGKRISTEYDTSFTASSLLKRWFLLFNTADIKTDKHLSDENSVLSDQQLKELIWKYKIFLDADSLVDKDAAQFFSAFSEKLLESKAQLILPLKAVEIIQQMMYDSKRAPDSIRALKLINGMQQKGVIQIYGDENDPELHDTILSVFEKYRRIYRLCIITQNKAFANKILQINRSNSDEGFDIIAGRLNEAGMLTLYSESDGIQEWPNDLPSIETEKTLTGWATL